MMERFLNHKRNEKRSKAETIFHPSAYFLAS